MHYIISKLKNSFLLLSLLTLILVNCNNDPASLGIDILPPTDVIFAAVDSQQIKVVNIMPEKVLSDGYSKDAVGFLGIFNDPVLGLTKADFVAELSVAAALDSFNRDGINFSKDSAVLYLYYTNNSWYGNKKSKLNVKVYELNERLDTDSAYYSSFEVEGKYFPQLLGEKIVTPYAEKNDSVWKAQKADTIRIKLSDEFADRLFEIKNISVDSKEERDRFKDIINGIYVTVDDEIVSADNGAILNIDVLNSLSNVTLYYKKEIYDLTTEKILGIKSQQYRFPISRAGRMFNRFEHSLSETIKIDEESSEKVFIQGLAGTFAKVDMTDIFEQWKDSVENATNNNVNLEISGVDITFYVDTVKSDLEKLLYMPEQSSLGIFVKDKNGKLIKPTFKNGGTSEDSFYDRGIASYVVANSSYRFSMKKDYFSQIINNEEEEQYFYLKIPNSSFNFKKVSLYNNDSKLYPKIKIRYVKF